jgi:hypothetical protein
MLGNGDGTFRGQIEYPAGDTPLSVAIADFNGDGKPDLAAVNRGSGTVSALLGDGNGGFGLKTDYGAGRDPYFVAIGDLNNDGKPDLAVADASSDMVSVLINLAPGTTDVALMPVVAAPRFQLAAQRPNPSRGTSEFRCVVPTACTVDVVLFDLAGREVRVLAAGEPSTPGDRIIRWDGRDASGTPVRAGIYLVRVRAGRDIGVRRLVVLR